MPLLTRTGLAAMGGLSALALAAALTGHPYLGIATLLSGALMLLAYARLALLLFELKRHRLEFTWRRLEGGDPPAGGYAELELYFRNHSVLSWKGVRVQFVGPSALVAPPLEVDLPRQAGIAITLRVHAVRAGPWMAWGAYLRFGDAAGLFRVTPYCPRPLPIRVRPPPSLTAGARPTSAPAEGGARTRRQRGLGTDLREIREHRHGDPFRRIAWKASARLGRLMVREFEAEVRVPVMLAVDVSPSMREGPPGAAPLDQALRAAYAFAQAALGEGDPVGLATFSGRCLTMIPPRLQAGQLRQIEEALLAATVDVPLDDVEDGRVGVLRTLATHLIREEGLRVAPDLSGPGDDVLIDVTATRVLERLRRQGRIASLPVDETERLRIFVLAHGLELPPAPREAWLPRERGLAETLSAATSGTRSRILMLVISDLAGIRDGAALARAVARARARLRVAVVVPSRPPVGLPASRRAARQIRIDAGLMDLAASRERRAVVSALTRAGAAALSASPTDDLRALLARAASYRETIRHAL
jgi:uncharacterized protein (DUF58 family)